ncbi:MAG: hypothetical protein HFJ38_01035 [Bacilli bacterium]|nr:hypothetical protein [Bacilli bacterium]
MLIFFKRKDYESELTHLKKAFEILNERYKQKTISLEEFTKQCDQLTKKIRKYERKIEKQK